MHRYFGLTRKKLYFQKIIFQKYNFEELLIHGHFGFNTN
jgi:hypothetical protein